MQKVLQWERSIPEYQKEFKYLQLEKPENCRCGCVKFHKWGKYERYVITENGEYIVPVQRICCVKCGKTYSYLPSFCVRNFSYGLDLIMAFLKALILRIRFDFDDRKRLAYAIRKRFVRLEKLWLVFLRARGFGDFPVTQKERTVKIFTALLKFHENKNLTLRFLEETGRHFMCVK